MSLYRSNRKLHEKDHPEYVSGFEVQFIISTGARRRYRFEPRHIAPEWWRFEAEWTGTAWRPVSREPVQTVTVRLPRATTELR